MNKKLLFSVENLEIDEKDLDSPFAKLSIDAFSSGNNAHDLYVGEAALREAAPTILEKPLVWVLDKTMMDAGSHSKFEVPCGFVPADSKIEFRQIESNKTMMRISGKIWSRYCGQLLEFFKRDQNSKPVSVEISVKETKQGDFGTEILSYVYECITILGTAINPAIKNAKADLISFAEKETADYNRAYAQEFNLQSNVLDFSVPESVRSNIKQGLELHKKFGRGSTSVGLSIGKSLLKENPTPEKVKQIFRYFESHKLNNIKESEIPTNEYISWQTWGGNEGYQWALELSEKIDKIDESNLKHIHPIKDSTWVKKEEMSVEDEKIEKKEEMATDMPEKDKEEEKKFEETPEEKKAEQEEEEKEQEEEKQEGEKEEMSNEENLDFKAILAMLAGETEAYEKVAEEEFSKPAGEKNFAKVCSALFSKMCKMSEKMCKMESDNAVYMAENEELRKFKSEMEAKQKEFEIETMFAELSKDVDIPVAEMEDMRFKALEFSLENIDGWKNYCKAKAFSFAVKNAKKDDEVKRYGLPFVGIAEKRNSSPWSR